MRRIGVLGGMMDPVHNGHIRAAMAGLAAGMDRVLLVPSRIPPHRPQPTVSFADRLAMCRLAAQADPRLTAAGIETAAGYAVEEARAVQRMYPDARLCWIIGADKLPSLSRWYQAETLFSLCDFYVCPRPGFDIRTPVPGARIQALPMEPLGVSSSDVIARLRRPDDAAELLPPGVGRYIAQRGLYQPDYIPILRRYGMADKRLAHTLGVRSTAVALAALHGAPLQAAGIAAMLHDIAKPLPLSEMQALARRYGLNVPQEILESGNLLHGPLAAAIAEHELGIDDPRVLSAIACHTTGKAGMTMLDKVLFLADAIEPSRADYPGLAEMRALAQTDLDAAVLLSMRRTQEYVLSRGLRLCSQTELAIQDLTSKRRNES